MATGFSAPQGTRKAALSRMYPWFYRNQSRLFALDIVCITLLFFMYLFTSTFQVVNPIIVNVVQASAIVLVAFIALSVVCKGLVPLVICVLGIVLIHNSIILPYYSTPEPGEAYFGDTRITWMLYSPGTVATAANMHFFLGASMVAFSIIVAYRPSLLFARNRPESLDSEWSKYPAWHDNSLLEGGHSEPSVPVKSLMTDQDRYLLWRYEYVLASIYGTPHLVRPEGLVPKDSTAIFRDKESGRMIGKARYAGYFV